MIRFKTTMFAFLSVGALLLVVLASTVDAADPDFTVIKSPKGAVVVWNEPPAYFSLELPGQKFAPANLPGASLIVDGHVVQVFTVKVSEFANDARCREDILHCYMEWETDYRRSTWKVPLATRELAPPAADFAAWDIEVPPAPAKGSGSRVIRQIYVTRSISGIVLVLSYSLNASDPDNAGEVYLGSVANSLAVGDRPIDVNQLRRDIARGGTQ